MTLEKTSILFNPSAGKGRALKEKIFIEQRLSSYGVPYDLFVTESEDHLKALAREHAKIYRTIAGAGGDSTFHLIVNEIVGHPEARASFAMIGIGSSNDITRDFRLDTVDAACRALKKGAVRRVDVGGIGDDHQNLRYFLGQANIGLGVSVNRAVERIARERPWLGKRQAAAGLLGIWKAYRSGEVPVSLTVASELGTTRGEFLAAVFSNIRYWATGRLIAPDARTDDGILDACLIRPCRLPRLLSIAWRMGKPRGEEISEVGRLRSGEFEISSETPFMIQTDGEILGGAECPRRFGRIRIRTHPGALEIVSL